MGAIGKEILVFISSLPGTVSWWGPFFFPTGKPLFLPSSGKTSSSSSSSSSGCLCSFLSVSGAEEAALSGTGLLTLGWTCAVIRSCCVLSGPELFQILGYMSRLLQGSASLF